MKKKYVNLVIIFVILFGLLSPSFIYVGAKNNKVTPQPVTCSGPSEMMSNYFNFQYEAIKILGLSDFKPLRTGVSFGKGGLFTNRVLNLNKNAEVSTVGSIVGAVLSTPTTIVLLLSLASVSVVQSNIEGFAILFSDRPIVRDYKEMLDIESRLFDVAYSISKKIDVNSPFESEALKNFNELINKYQKLGLLEPGMQLKGTETMADILVDLVFMNASMKQFIMVGGNIGKSGLNKYVGCFGNQDKYDCNRDVAILKFNSEAVDQLYQDYKDVRSFGKCNLYATSFKSTINKTVNNNLKNVNTAMKDVGRAFDRLLSALVPTYLFDKQKTRCDMSDYEIAQLQVYWGGDRSCEKGLVDLHVSSPLSETLQYFKNKRAQSKQKENAGGIMKKSKKSGSSNDSSLSDKLKNRKTTKERQQLYRSVIGSGIFNSDYSFNLDEEFSKTFEITMSEFTQAQENAMYAEGSDFFNRVTGLIDQINSVIVATDTLEKSLRSIEAKQCKS